MNLNNLARGILVLLIALTQQSCGEAGLSKDINIELLPDDSPLVSNAPFSIIDPGGDEIEISPPWFELGYDITNDSEQRLVVSTFEAEVSTGSNGEKKSYAPDFSVFESSRNKITMTPIDVGDTYTENVRWPFQSLPELDSFRYRVKITFYGYFVLEDDPNTEENEEGRPGARFEKSLTFRTR